MYRFNISSGKSLIYTSDTGWSEKLIEAVRGATALLIECTSSSKKQVSGHMTPGDISNLLKRYQPELTILSHLSPETDKATLLDEIYTPPGSQIIMAEDFKSFEI